MAGRKRPKRQRSIIIYDPKKIFALAEEFYRATDALAKAQWDAPLISKYSLFMYPSVVIAAFSLELYFKCLYVMDHDRGPDATHDLEQIFNALLPHTREEVIKRFDPSEGQATLQDLKARNPAAVKWGAPHTFDFKSVLFCSSAAFEHARYAYERAARPTEQWMGSPIVNAVRNFILESHPTWKYAVMRENMEIRIVPRALARLAQKRRDES